MAKPSDPFTSNCARVIDDTAKFNAAFDREATAALKVLGNTFGPTLGHVQFKQYYGEPGVWRCGFHSPFGFHVRGRGPTALAAVHEAVANRLPDDPGGPAYTGWIGRSAAA